MSITLSAYHILDQLDIVIKQLEENDFKKPLEVLSASTIGQHARHTLEFFICLIDAKNHGVVNYDNRKHDQLIESDPTLARSVIKSVREFLEKETVDFDLELQANYHAEQEESVKIRSNFHRELAYNIEHAIHHMALIKIGVKNHFSYVDLPEHFGVASSTVRYQKDQ